MIKFAPLAAVLVFAIVAGTYVHGIVSDRWSPQNSEQLDGFTECIPNLPKNIGEWEGIDDKIGDKEFALTNCTAYVSRRYINKNTGGVVSMYAVSGTARHITIHSPDWCYQGAGFKMDAKPAQYSIDCGAGGVPEFLTAVFRKPDPSGSGNQSVLRIFWTYSDDGKWLGPEWAKAYFAGKKALYKIYLICPTDPSNTALEESIGIPFAKEAFAEFNQALFPSGSDSPLPVDSDLDE